MTRPSARVYMKLGAFTHPTGNHVAAWRHPGAQVDAGTNVEHYIAFAQTAERAKFDLMFLADAVATRDGNLEALSRWPQYMAYFEPLTLLSAIASVTKRIGLVSTATTSYNEPYNVARKFASLDHISHGRAGCRPPGIVLEESSVPELRARGKDVKYLRGNQLQRLRIWYRVIGELHVFRVRFGRVEQVVQVLERLLLIGRARDHAIWIAADRAVGRGKAELRAGAVGGN